MTGTNDTPEPKRRRAFSPLLLSLSVGLHLAFFAVAGFLVVQEIALKRKLQFAPPPAAPSPAQAIEHKVTLQKKRSAAGAPPQARRIAVAGMAAKIAIPDMPAMPDSQFMPGRMAGMRGAGFGPGFGGGGTGMGVGGLGKAGLGLTMFGMRSSGDVVVVIDVSGSMVTGTKSRQSYDELEEEAVRAIRQLGLNAKFNVIVFSAEAEAYDKKLADSSVSAREGAIRWLKSKSPCHVLPPDTDKVSREQYFQLDKDGRHQGTASKKAITAAFGMRPTSILFVSDGEPQDAPAAGILAAVEEFQKQLPSKAVINTIAYKADSGHGFMKQLAEQNGGSFKNIE